MRLYSLIGIDAHFFHFYFFLCKYKKNLNKWSEKESEINDKKKYNLTQVVHDFIAIYDCDIRFSIEL